MTDNLAVEKSLQSAAVQREKPAALAGSGLVLAFVVMACSSAVPTVAPTPTPAASASSYTITGHIAVNAKHVVFVGDACVGSDDFADLKAGASVVVRNDAGTVIATGKLEKGEVIGACRFPFTVAVPTASFYSVTVAGRDPATYSFDEMVQRKWGISTQVGG